MNLALSSAVTTLSRPRKEEEKTTILDALQVFSGAPPPADRGALFLDLSVLILIVSSGYFGRSVIFSIIWCRP